MLRRKSSSKSTSATPDATAPPAPKRTTSLSGMFKKKGSRGSSEGVQDGQQAAPSPLAESAPSEASAAATAPMATISAKTNLDAGYTFVRVAVNLPEGGRLGVGLDKEFVVTQLVPGGSGALAGVEIDDQLVEVPRRPSCCCLAR